MKAYYIFRKYFHWTMNVSDVRRVESWGDGLCFILNEPDEDDDYDYRLFNMDYDIANKMVELMPELIRDCENEAKKFNSNFLFINLDKLYDWATKGKGINDKESDTETKDSPSETYGKKNWEEFKETGLLTFVNQFLHIFGWAIILSYDDKTNELKEVYPARVLSRGFAYESQIRAYKKLTNYMEQNSTRLKKEIDTQIS